MFGVLPRALENVFWFSMFAVWLSGGVGSLSRTLGIRVGYVVE